MSDNQFELKEVFESFQQFLTKLKAYEHDNNVLYVKKDVRKLLDHPDTARLEYEFVKYTCKQGSRRKSESKGIRPNQRTIKCDCESFIRLARCKVEGQYVLQLKAMNLEHNNHPVDSLTASVYPENRRATITDTIKAMCCSSMPRSQIREFIVKNQNKNILPHDVRNLSKKLKSTTRTDSEDVENVLKDIREGGGATMFGSSEERAFKFLFYFTNQMKQDLQMFGDVLIIDITHKVNKYHYPLISVLCIDSEGSGRPVLHGFVTEEESESLSPCLRFLKSACVVEPSVLFVDKDFVDVNTILETFPDTCVRFCAFHASKAVKEALQCFGLSSQDIGKLLNHFMEQRDTASQQRYLDLKRLMCADVPTSVVSYFEDNWWNKPQVWAAHTSLDLQTFHMTSNNHVEAYHGKLKHALDSRNSLSECLITLMNYDKNLIHTRNIKRHINSISRQYNTTDTCPVVQTIKNHLSTFASKAVVNQLALARSMSYRVVSTTDDVFEVTDGDHDSETFSVTVSACDCSFFLKFKLPCRHMFFVKMHLKLPLCEPADLSNTRFSQRVVCSITTPPTLKVSSESSRSPPKTIAQTGRLESQSHSNSKTNTQKGRFEIISDLTSQINWCFQNMSEESFVERVKQLETFFNTVKQDKPILFMDDSTLTFPKTLPKQTKTTLTFSKLPFVTSVADSTMTVPISRTNLTTATHSTTASDSIVTTPPLMTDLTIATHSTPVTDSAQTLPPSKSETAVTASVFPLTATVPSSDTDTKPAAGTTFSSISLPSVKSSDRPQKRPNVSQEHAHEGIKRQALSSDDKFFE